MIITPTGITISFAGSQGGADQRPVIARIFGFARGAEDSPISREMVVPAGQSVKQDLDAGIYSVELRLPSGRILQRNVTIDENSNEVYRFFEDFVPNAGFSLQEASGRTDRELLVEAASASGNTSSEDYAWALRRSADIDRGGRGSRGRAGLGAKRGIRFRVAPGEYDHVAPPRLACVSLHDDLAPWRLKPPARGTDENVAPEEMHGDSALWRIVHPSGPWPAVRRWARAAMPDGSVELASLPLPWFCNDSGDFAAADLLVDPSRQEGAATTVAVRDKRLAGLLAYLDRGQAGSARPLLEQLERDDIINQTIFDKMSNPLAACAAAYVGLSVYPPQEREQWDGWLGNCMNRFPDVPDAAIVHARRMVLRPSSASDNLAAVAALRRAFAAGLPYFSAGLLLLREMLVLLSPDHPDLGRLADKVGIFVGRVDASQVFTVLRYAPDKEQSE